MPGVKRSSWVADFETTTNPEDCRVWGWGLADIDRAQTVKDVEIGTDIDSFLERMSQFNGIVYFHNLKFDGFFILDWLLRNGYAHITEGTQARGQFSSLISNMGAFYTITVSWLNGKKTEFRDSLKKLPFSVAVVAKAFGMEEAKGSIDYNAERPVGYIPTPEEEEYIGLDVLIVAKALKLQFDNGMKRLTVGSDSLFEFKNIMGSKIFTKMFPVLADTMDAEIRQAYRGGWTIAPKQFRGRILGKGCTYDVNSLYPSVMYDRMLPYGEPVFKEGVPEVSKRFPLFITSITFTAKLKPNHVPIIQVKGSSHFVSTEYQENIKDPITMMVSSVDLKLWEEHYDLDILCWNGSWMFHGVAGVFKKFIDKWMEVKASSDGGMRALAKLQLNSLYGKFATNPNVTGKIPVLEDNRVKLVMGPPETTPPVYTAMGVFITAYAREVTIRAAQANYDVFAYADTDSLHLLVDEDPEDLHVDPHALGAWKFEYAFDRALFIRAKTYIEHIGPGHCKKDHEHQPGCEHETHVAGLPVKIGEKLTIEDFTGGRKFDGKLQPERVPGGIILKDTTFTLPKW